ncbi:UNVERIFIED_CONTAM: hypothetical protein Slati_4576400 [Sesamum latifolium]|uniref:Uncharacterized protein n=1 Tax=Sesamum latifolium TaxID=2727402 RepID=A0AAW2SFR6_9LAMI
MRQEEQMVQLTRDELQRMIKAASRNAIVEYERRTVAPDVREPVRRQLFSGKGKKIADEPREVTSRAEREKRQEKEISDAGSSKRTR